MMRLRNTEYAPGKPASGTAAASVSLLSWVWYALGAIVLGVLLAKWSWTLLKSPATAAAVVPGHGDAAASGRLFGAVSAGSPAAATAAALPDVKLVGVFAPNSGHSGFAVLKLDEKRQVGAVVGASVAPAVRLLEVHADHVVLDSAGVRQKVEMVNANAGASGMTPAGR
jgi:hypothetical protein